MPTIKTHFAVNFDSPCVLILQQFTYKDLNITASVEQDLDGQLFLQAVSSSILRWLIPLSISGAIREAWDYTSN